MQIRTPLCIVKAVFLATITGVLPRILLTTLGTRTLTMAIRTTTIRITRLEFVVLGVLSNTSHNCSGGSPSLFF